MLARTFPWGASGRDEGRPERSSPALRLDNQPFADDVLRPRKLAIKVRAIRPAEGSAVLVSVITGLPARVH